MEEHSHTPYFIAGIALAVWGLSMGLIGVVSKRFASSSALSVIVMLGTVALVASTMTAAIATSE